jgi:disulfide bond formation protein DsbB
VIGFTLVALLMCFLPVKQWLYAVANLLVIACAIGLGERSWYLYLIENGRGDGSCEFQLGLPDWFALDRWFPDLFEVRNLCTYTPEMLFGLSMAESLLLAAAAIVAVAVLSLYATSRAGTAS